MRGTILIIGLMMVAGCMESKQTEFQKGALKLTSHVFNDGGSIPARYTCDGEGKSPPLKFEGVPENAQTLALTVDDPDAPNGDFTHWVAWNIDPKTTDIDENASPGTQGLNGFGNNGWGGPCPPMGQHRYIFKAYALDSKINLPKNAGLKELENAISGHILAQTQLTGKYQRQ